MKQIASCIFPGKHTNLFGSLDCSVSGIENRRTVAARPADTWPVYTTWWVQRLLASKQQLKRMSDLEKELQETREGWKDHKNYSLHYQHKNNGHNRSYSVR